MNEIIILNGKRVSIEQATLDQLVAAEVRETRHIAAAVNGAVVPRSEWSNTRLRAGDQVEIIKVMVGG
jgi:sulfur carrier protein